MVAGTEIIDGLLKELVAIKRLMAFDLLRSGATQAEIAKALGTSQSQISEMFTKGARSSKKSRKRGKSRASA
jgi:predicted transcriptional regulator